MLGQRIPISIRLLFLILSITLAQGGCAVPIRPDEPLISYEIGRLLVTVPQSLKPVIESTTFMWESDYYEGSLRCPVMGYPITLWEQAYKTRNNSNAELLAIVGEIRKKNREEIVLEWDVSQLFGAPAYFICYSNGLPRYDFHVIIASQLCLLNIRGLGYYVTPEIPTNGSDTAEILQALVKLYSKYRPGHNTRTGNVLYTFYGEIVGNPLATDEIMSAQFENSQWTLSVETNANPHNFTEDQLRTTMERWNSIGGLRRSQMRKMRHFGFGYEYFTVSGNYTELAAR